MQSPFSSLRLSALTLVFVGMAAMFFISGSHALADADGSLGFGYGRAIHLVDPDGTNAVPFITNTTQPVTFALYRADVPAFLRWYKGYTAYNTPPVDVGGLPLQASWQQSFTPETQAAALPAGIPSGLYALTATDSGSTASTMIVVSRHVLVLKRDAAGQISAWATNLQQSQPVDAMAITLYDADGNALANAVTDVDGLTSFPPVAGTPVMAVGQSGAELTVAGLDWQWQSDGSYWWATPAEAYRIYLYTDRPLYRPGHTIHFSAIVRANTPGGYTVVAPSLPLTATLRDARNNVVATQGLAADGFGMVAGEFLLGDEPPLGDYQLSLAIGTQVRTQTLRVEEYRKPEYAVAVDTPAAFAIRGDPIAVTVAADYFFGQPVAGADVTLKVYQEARYYYYSWWMDGMPPLPGSGAAIATFTGKTDQAGRWQMSFLPEQSARRRRVLPLCRHGDRRSPAAGGRGDRRHCLQEHLRADGEHASVRLFVRRRHSGDHPRRRP